MCVQIRPVTRQFQRGGRQVTPIARVWLRPCDKSHVCALHGVDQTCALGVNAVLEVHVAVFLSRRMCIHGRGEFKRSSSGGQTRRRGGFPNAALRRRSFYCGRAILPRFWHVALTECKNQSSRSAFALSPLVIWSVLSLLCLPCSQIPLPLQSLQWAFCLPCSQNPAAIKSRTKVLGIV